MGKMNCNKRWSKIKVPAKGNQPNTAPKRVRHKKEELLPESITIGGYTIKRDSTYKLAGGMNLLGIFLLGGFLTFMQASPEIIIGVFLIANISTLRLEEVEE